MPPPPWKKARLSRIVSDHLTSPTHGGTLVVETGFPTSVVDLFVKNRHRMKKSSSSKRNSWTTEINSEPADSLYGGSPFIGDIFMMESVSSSTTPRSPLDSLRSPRRSLSESILMNESIDQENSSKTVGGGDGRGTEAKGYFWPWWWWIFKVFFVVVLAMAMAKKQLAVGITASVSSLLLMELLGNYLLKPWLNARKSLKNNNGSSPIESQSKEVQIEESDCNADVVDSKNVAETPIPEPNTHLRDIRAMKSILNSPRFHKRSASDGTAEDLHAFKSFNLNWFSSKEGKVETEDANNENELDQIARPPLDHADAGVPNQIVHKSRSRKIKSKIKKFVKKLRISKKERTDRRSNSSFAGSASESVSIPSSIKLFESHYQLCGYLRRRSGRVSWRSTLRHCVYTDLVRDYEIDR